MNGAFSIADCGFSIAGKTRRGLSVAKRKRLVAEVAATATAKVRAGLKLIDFRRPTARERADAETLTERAHRFLARGKGSQ